MQSVYGMDCSGSGRVRLNACISNVAWCWAVFAAQSVHIENDEPA